MNQKTIKNNHCSTLVRPQLLRRSHRALLRAGRTVALFCLAAASSACLEDTGDTDDDGGSGTGCAECSEGFPFACMCEAPNGDMSPLGADYCLDPMFDQNAFCNTQCENAHTPDWSGGVIPPTCIEGGLFNCSSWNPSANVSVVSGVYHVNAAWLATVVANPSNLWGCDNAYLNPLSDDSGFEIKGASSGELIYLLGLRNGDRPLAINGISLANFAAGYTVYAAYLNGTTAFTLTIRRGGSILSWSITLV